MSKDIRDFLVLYLPFEFIWIGDAVPFKNGETGTMDLINLQYWDENKKPLLRPLADIKEEEMEELWVIVGGAAHLYVFGRDELKKGLQEGDWGESGIQMDYYTMSCLINYLRKIGIDCDDLIESGMAIDKTTI